MCRAKSVVVGAVFGGAGRGAGRTGLQARGAVPERNNKPNLGQALHVLAGATYAERLGRPNSRLANLLESGRRDEDIFAEFYLAALSRPPWPDEVRELKNILAQRGDREAGLRRLVWALVSSGEFAENHQRTADATYNNPPQLRHRGGQARP